MPDTALFPMLRPVEIDRADFSVYALHLADSVIKTHDGKILLQYRPPNWREWPDILSLFGGHVERGETIVKALLRELKEELGAVVAPANLVFLGGVTEDWTKHKELVHIYFWHDKDNTITGCYEAEARTYMTVEEAVSQPNLMPYARWALITAQEKGLL